MKTIFLSLLLLTFSTESFCTVHAITRSGYTFVPSPLTITLGDSVEFQLSTFHSVVEVSQTTWNANGTTPLPGFSLPLGGGFLYPSQLTVGTHYYVCGEHATTEGMKGIIIVQYPESIEENLLNSNILIYPNPSNGKFQLQNNSSGIEKSYDMEIYNSHGKMIYETLFSKKLNLNKIDISEFPKGIYFLRLNVGDAICNRKIIIQ